MIKQVFSLGVTKRVFSLGVTKQVFSLGVIKQVLSLSRCDKAGFLFTDVCSVGAVLWSANNDCLSF